MTRINSNSRKGFWGKDVIKSISELLRRELPELRGFAEASLKKMRSFYEEWQMIDSNSFVATNELEKFGQEEFPDLLSFNSELAAMDVVELKDGPFKTSYLGQLCGYLRILDDNLKKPHENPSIKITL